MLLRRQKKRNNNSDKDYYFRFSLSCFGGALLFMVGIGFDINNIADDVLQEIDIVNIENPLYPNYLSGNYIGDTNRFKAKSIAKKIIVDGPYIDLNPGTPDIEIRKVVERKVLQSIDFALSIGSDEIIFLSTFLPMIQVDFYDNAHVSNSINFWRNIISKTEGIKISLCNIFEYDPSVLLKIVEGVNCINFGLAFDVGHAYAYAKTTLKDFFTKIESFCSSVYLHGNNGTYDEHLNIFEGDLLKSDQFQDIIPLIRDKNIILKPFDKSMIIKNVEILKSTLIQ